MQRSVIRRAAVLGAGTMGSQIAALLASAGIPVVLLDVVPESLEAGASRNVLAENALQRLVEQKPAPLMHRNALGLITPGNLQDDLPRLAQVDWVIEAVVEQLAPKQAVWRRAGEFVRAGTVLSSNTSGLSCAAQASVLPAEHQRHFLGTHFFNPPRYLKLLEVVPVPATDPQVVADFTAFAERTLGKRVVTCNDTPNFIANRIGTYGLLVTLRVMEELGLSVDEVDAITGPPLGRPRSATFRTLDLVGLDTCAHVARNGATATDDEHERTVLALPTYVEQMLERGWLGEKSGQGFYKRIRGKDGESEILALDLKTMEYGPRSGRHFGSIEAAQRIQDAGERIQSIIAADDPAGRFVWRTFSQTLAFCAAKAQEIANGDVNAIDRAMRWGFGWEAGPFETWNAVGVQATIERMAADGLKIPEWVRRVERFPVDRETGEPLSFATAKAGSTPLRAAPSPARAGPRLPNDRPAGDEPLPYAAVLKQGRERVVKSSPGASLVNLGDDVLGLDFHSPKQAIGQDYVAMANAAAEEVRRNWRGLVISANPANGANFCVGANLLMLLTEAQDENWDEIDRAVRAFQQVNLTLKYLERPVVVAPFGITVGGGAEVAMACARTVAAAETYLGLVEVGVGLIPAGGGCAELARRCAQMLPPEDSRMPNKPELIGFVSRAFETVAQAKVSTSAAEARDLGYLRPTDSIVMNGDFLLQEAKQAVLELERQGYRPPTASRLPVAGPEGRAVLELAAYTLQNSGYATEYDRHVAKRLAFVLTGGNLPAGTPVPEEYLLDLEREAFLHLCGQPKTQARMAHMLQKNRPLRN